MDIVIENFESDGKTININPPLRLEVEQGAGGCVVKHDELDLCLGSLYLSQLWEDVLEHLSMLWIMYGKEPEERLTPNTIKLKRNILARMQEAKHE